MRTIASHTDSMESTRSTITELYPLELHYVKALFLQKQYRQCISTCREILKLDHDESSLHSLRRTFVHFYLALAHDELARSMHNYSQAKVPAFNQAEQFYDDALLALPTPEECLTSVSKFSANGIEQQNLDPGALSRDISSHSFTSNMTSRPSSLSPPTHIRHDSLPMRSPPMSPPGTTTSEFDDMESHDSFNEIMTPNRVPKLERDYSSISLLQPQQRHTSHTLMRPIRMGSPAKPYHFSSRISQSGSRQQQQQRSKLPRLSTSSALFDSAVRKQLRSPSELDLLAEAEPVSPLGSEGGSIQSDPSTISPISPETPMGGPQFGSSKLETKLQPYYRLVDQHLQALRAQLRSHLELLQAAKQRALDVQAERSSTRSAPTKGGQLASLVDATNAKRRGLPQTASFWSFTPEDVKAMEKLKHIERGRERGWSAPRFDPRRYVELADAALAEL